MRRVVSTLRVWFGLYLSWMVGLDDVCKIVRRSIDQGGDRESFHFVVRIGAQEVGYGLQGLVAFFQPKVVVRGCDDDRHTIMNRPDDPVCPGRNDGKGIQVAGVAVGPGFPEAGKCESAVGCHTNVKRLFFGSFVLPLEKTAARHQAASFPKSVFEAWLFQESLRPGVYHPSAHFGVFGPGRHQTPSKVTKYPGIVVWDDQGGLIGGDVVTGPKSRHVCRQQTQRLQVLGGDLDASVSTAHVIYLVRVSKSRFFETSPTITGCIF